MQREPLLRIIERREGKRDAFSDARRGSRKGVSVRKSRCIDIGMTPLNEGYKPGAFFCKNEHGNLVTDPQRVLR